MKLVPLTARHIQIMAAIPDDQVPDDALILGTACIGDDGWPVALGGVHLMGKQAEAFAHLRNVAGIYPVTIAHMVVGFLDKLHELGVEVVIAYPDPIPRAERFLEWLGFRPNGVVTERDKQYVKWVSVESSPSSAQQ